MVIQWMRFHTPSARGLSLIPGQRTRSYILQLNIQHATTEDPWENVNFLNEGRKDTFS